MGADLLSALLDVVQVVRPAFTRPGFDNMLVVFAGWVLTAGPHAVTQALVMTGVAGRRHHEAFHRFFSRGTWAPDELGRLLFLWMLERVPAGAIIRIAIDDTLAEKKGAHVFGIGTHLDAVRSTKRCKVFCFGHCWVVLCILVQVPFSNRSWALPILFRLYRNKKECANKGHTYRKKTELAREMLDVLVSWAGERVIMCAADSAYCNDTVMRKLPSSVTMLGSMRPDAVLTALPEERARGSKGRPSQRGAVLPKPLALAADDRHPWQKCTAMLYGEQRKILYKECVAQWYRAAGLRLVHIVVVKVQTGKVGIRVFFSTDTKMSVQEILEGYAGRWSIEVCFRNLKQMMGFSDSSARKQEAVERTAPFVGFAYTMIVLWFAQHAQMSPLATLPLRPWYSQKRGFSFADVLRTAQRALAPLDVLDPARSHANLHQLPPRVVPLRAASENSGSSTGAEPRRRAA